MSRALPPFRTLLPPEHGSWFMLGFPLALGLLLRPSLAGLLLALAALAGFLARPPLRRVLGGQRDPLQLRALALFGLLGLGLGAAAVIRAGAGCLVPLAAVAPLAGLALWADVRREVRALWVEVAAQGAFAGLASALVLAGGGDRRQAGAAWLFTTLVGAANLAHVRRLLGHARQLAGPELRRRWVPVHGAHLLLLLASAGLLAPQGLPGQVWTGWAVLLYARALAPYRPLPARSLGWREGGLSVLGMGLLAWALR